AIWTDSANLVVQDNAVGSVTLSGSALSFPLVGMDTTEITGLSYPITKITFKLRARTSAGVAGRVMALALIQDALNGPVVSPELDLSGTLSDHYFEVTPETDESGADWNELMDYFNTDDLYMALILQSSTGASSTIAIDYMEAVIE